MKRCSKCGTDKPLSDFYIKRSSGKERPYSACKVCHNAATRDWMAANRERTREIQRKAGAVYRQRHPDKFTYALYSDEKKEQLRRRAKEYAASDEGRRERARRARELIDRLGDSYLKQMLRRAIPHVSASQIPTELVDAKREQLAMKRLTKELEQMISTIKEKT